MAITPQQLSGTPKIVYGTWTHTAGATEETFDVQGMVFGAIFMNGDTSTKHDVTVPYSISTSGGTTTLTVHGVATVTTGRFIIWYI